jgi:hypothetical protein
MKKSFQAVTLLFLFFILFSMGGCDQAEDLATQTLEKAKKDVVTEITKSVGGGEQKEENASDRDADTEEEK